MKVLCILDFVRQLNNDLFLVPFSLICFCILAIQLTKQKKCSGELYKDRHLPISAFYNVLKWCMFGVCMFAFLSLTYWDPVVVEDMICACVPKSPLPQLHQMHFWRKWSWKVTLMMIMFGFELVSLSSLGVEGGKEGNRNAWSQFWNIFRSEEFILEEEKSISIFKKAIIPVNNLHSGHSRVKNSRKNSLEKVKGREYV